MGRRADEGERAGAGRPGNWQEVVAPSLDDFQVLAEKALEELPETFRALCGAIEIRVADFADDEALDGLGIEDPFELLGLFDGSTPLLTDPLHPDWKPRS